MSKVVAITAVVMFAASACNAEVDFNIDGLSLDEAGEQLVEGELSELLSLELVGECDEVKDPKVGVTFECTGTDANGRVITFDGVLEREDFVNVVSTNAIQAQLVPSVEEAAVAALTPQTGPVEVACGTETLVLDDNDEVRCLISDGNDTRDVILTFSSLNPVQFNASVQ